MKTIIKIIGLFIVFVAIAFAAALFSFQIFTTTATIDAPDLKGLSIIEANMVLSKNKIYMKIEGEDNDSTILAGHILRQGIPPNSKIKEGRSIGVILSKGPYILNMPNFTGIPQKEAEDTAFEKKIKIKYVVYVHSDTVGKSTVIAQYPAPEDKGGKDLVLLVSAGGYENMYYCPDFTGKTVEEANTLGKALGLNINTTGDGGIVSAQEPSPYEIIRAGAVVKLNTKQQEEKIEEKEVTN